VINKSDNLLGGNLLWVMEEWNASHDGVRSGKSGGINNIWSDIHSVVWNELPNGGNLLQEMRERNRSG
jgi:hypothetical protein